MANQPASWALVISRKPHGRHDTDITLSDADREHIAALILGGHTEGDLTKDLPGRYELVWRPAGTDHPEYQRADSTHRLAPEATNAHYRIGPAPNHHGGEWWSITLIQLDHDTVIDTVDLGKHADEHYAKSHAQNWERYGNHHGGPNSTLITTTTPRPSTPEETPAMDRKTFILFTLNGMSTGDLYTVVGLDIADEASGRHGNLTWTVGGDGRTVRSAILSDLKDMVVEAYEADAVDAGDEMTVLSWIEGLRKETRLIDYMLIGNAQRLAPLGGEYAAGVGTATTVEEIISDAVQDVYDQAAQRLVKYLENEARNEAEALNHPEVQQ